jgi:L-threonylcarbamoyladenylate synthase
MSFIFTERDVLRDQVRFAEVFECLRTGGVVIYPSETVYSLGGALSSIKATEKIFAVKSREKSKALLSIVFDLRQAESFCVFRFDLEYEFFRRFGEKGLTVLLDARPFVSTRVRGGADTLGVRLASTDLAREFTQRLAEPISSTMANFSNKLIPDIDEMIPHRMSDVPQQLIDQVDYVIDGGELPNQLPSTVIRVEDENRIVLLREGVVKSDDIKREFNVEVEIPQVELS